MKSQDPNECRVQAAKCIRKTSLCVDAKARDALYKRAKEWLELAVSLERAHRQNGSRLAALANYLERQDTAPNKPIDRVPPPGRHVGSRW
jgi:hypothetical protein